MYGCCGDNQTPAAGPDADGCPLRITCDTTAFGCCPDGETIANGFSKQGCPSTSTAGASTGSLTTLTTTTVMLSKEETTKDVKTSSVMYDDVISDTTSSESPASQITSQDSTISQRSKKRCRPRTATTPTMTSTTTEFGLISQIFFVLSTNCCIYKTDLLHDCLFICSFFTDSFDICICFRYMSSTTGKWLVQLLLSKVLLF